MSWPRRRRSTSCWREEFPRQAGSEWVDAVSRRGFLKVMGASLALAGLAGCTKQPDEPIFPYVKAAGGSDSGQADVLCHGVSVPDGRDSGAGEVGRVPARSRWRAIRSIRWRRASRMRSRRRRCWICTIRTARSMCCIAARLSSWAEFPAGVCDAAKKTAGGQGVYFLSETITSPTLAAQWKQVQAKYPQAKLVQWEPVNQRLVDALLRRRRSAATWTRSTSWKRPT